MATESVNATASYDLATLRLAQAQALIEMIGIASQYGPDDNMPTADAASGVNALLEQAGSAFRRAQEAQQ